MGARMFEKILEGIEVKLNTDYFSNREYFNSVKSDQSKLFLDGISTLKYDLVKTIEDEQYKLYQVIL